MRSASPLRYPGGKWRLSGFLSRYLAKNFDRPPEYIEPYAGGASLALSLLFAGAVSRIWLNDLDPAIHACWHAMLESSERFCRAIERIPVTPEEWRNQRLIYARASQDDPFSLGFATFYLNRTNHSGILNGGMIGGKSQSGRWLLDARFNRAELVRRIRQIAQHRSRIKVTRLDARHLLVRLRRTADRLVYLDPPYVTAGRALYMNFYKEADHAKVREAITRLNMKWIVSYDDVPLIRKLYRGFRPRRLDLLHTARAAKLGREVLFFSPDSVIPLRVEAGTSGS